MNGRPASVIYFMIITIILILSWGVVHGPAVEAGEAPGGTSARGAGKSLMFLDEVAPKALATGSKLDRSLALLAGSEPSMRKTVAARSGHGALKIKDGMVEAIVLSQEGRREEAAAAVVRAGGKVISLAPGNLRRFKASLPIEALVSLAEQESVSYVKRPQYLPQAREGAAVSAHQERRHRHFRGPGRYERAHLARKGRPGAGYKNRGY